MLQDRNYMSNNAVYTDEVTTNRLVNFVKQTYILLTASLVAATAGAYIGMSYLSISYSPFLFFIIEIALLFGLTFAVKANNNSLALLLLFAFTFITGLGLAPVLNFYISNGMGNVVTNAFLMTTIIFGALTLYAIKTKRDFLSMGKALFFTLIIVVVASFLNYFIFKSSMLQTAISAVCAFLFSFYIVFDTQNIFKGRYQSPVLAAVSMYLNILNLFYALLSLLSDRK